MIRKMQTGEVLRVLSLAEEFVSRSQYKDTDVKPDEFVIFLCRCVEGLIPAQVYVDNSLDSFCVVSSAMNFMTGREVVSVDLMYITPEKRGNGLFNEHIANINNVAKQVTADKIIFNLSQGELDYVTEKILHKFGFKTTGKLLERSL